MLNEEVGNIWGYRQDELLGRSVGMLLPAESRVRYRAAFETYLKVPVGERPEPRFSIEGLRKDGTVFPLEVTVAQTWFGERLLLTAAVRDIPERVRAENQIKSALREKEALLKEIHHRVKNNLQVIVSLLYLQAAHLKDEQAFAAFRDSESRVKSMALLHEKLYRSKNLSKIDMSDYVQALTRDLFLTYRLGSPRIQLTLDIENIALGMDTALHCGLIINELASNSLKHAFPGESSGQLSVVLRDLGSGTYSLVVRDDGIGLPEGTLLGKRASSGLETIGLDLVLTLVEHLEGRLEVETEGGTTVKIVFKDVDADQPETVVA
jgi:PAS domain S-box-containing protein